MGGYIVVFTPVPPPGGLGGRYRREHSRFLHPRGPSPTFTPLYMLGLEPETCGNRTLRGLLRRNNLVSCLGIDYNKLLKCWLRFITWIIYWVISLFLNIENYIAWKLIFPYQKMLELKSSTQTILSSTFSTYTSMF